MQGRRGKRLDARDGQGENRQSCLDPKIALDSDGSGTLLEEGLERWAGRNCSVSGITQFYLIVDKHLPGLLGNVFRRFSQRF